LNIRHNSISGFTPVVNDDFLSSYRDIWVDRFGYDSDPYERAIAETLAELGATPE
jgi:hypothetical protein